MGALFQTEDTALTCGEIQHLTALLCLTASKLCLESCFLGDGFSEQGIGAKHQTVKKESLAVQDFPKDKANN